jgi:hypothetical protein
MGFMEEKGQEGKTQMFRREIREKDRLDNEPQ